MTDEHDARRAAIETAARRYGFRNPAIAAEVLAGAEGSATDLVRRLAEQEPYLVGTEALAQVLRPDAPAGDHDMRSLLMAVAGRPDPEPAPPRQEQQERVGDWGGGNRGQPASTVPSQSDQMNEALRALRRSRADPINDLGKTIFGPHDEE